jgi:hypothetical protein
MTREDGQQRSTTPLPTHRHTVFHVVCVSAQWIPHPSFQCVLLNGCGIRVPSGLVSLRHTVFRLVLWPASINAPCCDMVSPSCVCLLAQWLLIRRDFSGVRCGVLLNGCCIQDHLVAEWRGVLLQAHRVAIWSLASCVCLLAQWLLIRRDFS